MASGRERGAAAAVTSTAAEDIAIYLCQDPTDFRLGINGLSVLVEATLKYDPFSRNLLCFVNKRKNQIKVLYWQRSGFCLWQKRLEEERLWPTHLDPVAGRQGRPGVVSLSEEQFFWLLEGLDLKHLKPHRALEYRTVL